jgi:hypothetical protein
MPPQSLTPPALNLDLKTPPPLLTPSAINGVNAFNVGHYLQATTTPVPLGPIKG